MTGDNPERVMFVGAVIDITDRKRAEEERERLHKLEADLARINRVTMMGELAASLAHEIQHPIGTAINYARACTRWLERDAPDVTEARNAASAMVVAAMRAASIIDRVRSLYRRDTPEHELVDLNEIIREMTVLLGDTAHRSAVSIRTDLDPSLLPATADRVQLQQMLMNLMLNGIEAMKEGKGELHVPSNKTEDDQLLVSVSDTGAAFPRAKASASSRRSSPRSLREPAWDCRSAAGSSRRMAATVGEPQRSRGRRSAAASAAMGSPPALPHQD